MRRIIFLLMASTVCVSLCAADVPGRTLEEVDKLIASEGATPPPWFDAVKLNFPPTLLLHWERPQPKEPWTPNKYVSQYIWSSINENPGRWREGLKFLYHLLDVNKDDSQKTEMTQRAIARNYQYLQQDPLRAAYWWRKSGIEKEPDAVDSLPLANCILKLGNKDFPRKILKAADADETRHGEVIKLWADLGDYDKALEFAKIKAENDDPDVAHLMAGETYRLMGKSKEALDEFQKVLAVDDKKAGRDVKQTKARARASVDAIKFYDALDLTKISDGTYTADSTGYSGQVSVAVGVQKNKIESVKVVKHSEKQYYASLTDTPAQIIKKQSVKGIDAFSGATITSEAIINATAKALGKAVK